jgi:hypothetical protein
MIQSCSVNASASTITGWRPSEDMALVPVKHRTDKPHLMLEGGAELLAGAGVPQPRCSVSTPGEDAALVPLLRLSGPRAERRRGL